jgi:hypothetical protein
VRFEMFHQDAVYIAAHRDVPVGNHPDNFRYGRVNALTDINALPRLKLVAPKEQAAVICIAGTAALIPPARSVCRRCWTKGRIAK